MRPETMRLAAFTLLLTCALSALLTGCTLETTAAPDPVAGSAISGVAFGGQQAIAGAKVYLLSANSTNYNVGAYSLLTAASTGNAADTVGSYALTAAGTGKFTITGDYDCTKGYALGASTTGTATTLSGSQQVYLYVLGGNAGFGTNSSIGLLAALGPCNALVASTVVVNEVTTVAAAYAFSGFMSNATQLSAPNRILARTGIANAGLNAANLVSIATGLPVASTATATRSVANIYTLADILAACVNSNGSSSSCGTVFQYAKSAGTTGTTATDTATAAINLAHNPWPTAAGMTALYGLAPATGAPFVGGLATQPNDFTLAVFYPDGASTSNATFQGPIGIAIDGFGNAWVSNYSNTISEYSTTGTPISPTTGYTGGGLAGPRGIAIDYSTGNVWTANYTVKGVKTASEFNSSGTPLSPSTGWTGGGLNNAFGVAIDKSGNAWLTNYGNNSLSEFTEAGTATSPSTGYGVNDGLIGPISIAFDTFGESWIANGSDDSIAEYSSTGGFLGYYPDTNDGSNAASDAVIDGSNNVWVANDYEQTVTKFNNSGTAVSTGTGYTGGGIGSSANAGPNAIAIDGSGTAWTVNDNSTLSRFSSAGAAISPPTGYNGYSQYTGTYTGTTGNGIAIDLSGNVWVTDYDGSSLQVLIGAATPVATPLNAALNNPYNAAAAKP